mgnify:CR=1 FL=1
MSANADQHMTTADVAPGRRPIDGVAVWLYAVAAMVFTMVVLGGLTRLTHSGLSMVEWRPVTGWLPPMDDAAWARVFEMYKGSPEYREVNADMTLAEFKGIFWLEFLHRLWGRLIGVAFAVPFAYFVVKGMVSRRLGLWLVGIFALGGLQGGLGWFMVKSGLVDQPDVSQYRLAAHLSLALLIYGLILWIAIGRRVGRRSEQVDDIGHSIPSSAIRRTAAGLLGLISITIFSGALMAGLDAGLTYNTFPLMDGSLVPDGMMTMSPVYLNFFENITTVQFDHRVLAVSTFFAVLGFWWRLRGGKLPTPAYRAASAMAAMVVVQASLGIATLLLVVPIALGVLHQAGAVILLGTAVWALRELTPK